MATKRKNHLPGLWTAKHQAEARTRGWSLQWVFDAQGQILGLEPFAENGALTPSVLRRELHHRAQAGDKFCSEAIRAMLMSKVEK